MILKKQEKNGKIKAMYSSSNICASIYDTTTNELTLIFNNGGQYKYTGVSNTDYMRFEIADSQGSVMNTHIKKYPFTKLDKVDTTEILKEVEELSKQMEPEVTPEMATKQMLGNMTEILDKFIKNGNITASSLGLLKVSMSQYEEVIKKQPVLAD
ncbi:MAG: KTSC domain-containing protein [Spirochaetes bacterium]|nr:MAG: KTSC domain-containing protein [Spirochaetota bacterium]